MVMLVGLFIVCAGWVFCNVGLALVESFEFHRQRVVKYVVRAVAIPSGVALFGAGVVAILFGLSNVAYATKDFVRCMANCL